MKRKLWMCCTLALILEGSLGTAQAATDKPIGTGTGTEATAADWAAFGDSLSALQDQIADVKALIHGGGDAQQEMREKQCRYQWLDKRKWTAREERKTAECVVAKWGVVGGLSELISVGDCESGWYRFASNGGRYLGLFQHAADYWSDRVDNAMPEAWKIGPWGRWTNSRSQIVTTVRMVNGAGGWGAWSCA